MNRCRFCKAEHDAQGAAELVKYGPRHYAHVRCGFERKGPTAFLGLLHDWQVANLPYFTAREFGVEKQVEEAYARQKAAERVAARRRGAK